MKKSQIDIPIKEKYCITIPEAAAYFMIGQNRLRQIVSSNRSADYLLWVGDTVRIKREEFERYLSDIRYI